MLSSGRHEAGGPELGWHLLAVAQQPHLLHASQFTFGEGNAGGDRLSWPRHAGPFHDAQFQ